MTKIKNALKRRNRSSLRWLVKQEHRHARSISKRDVNRRMKQINKEFKQGFKLLMKHPDTVTFFGSARFDENNKYYQQARDYSRSGLNYSHRRRQRHHGGCQSWRQ
jgi:hypothetical protein